MDTVDTVIAAVNLSALFSTMVAAGVFVLLMSLLPEPARQQFNAIFVAGAGAVYLNGGFGLWEFAYIAIATVVAFLGLRSYFFIGCAWVLHTLWDLAHHFWGLPIWLWAPTSSAGCAVFDILIALWFFAGAPRLFKWWQKPGGTLTG